MTALVFELPRRNPERPFAVYQGNRVLTDYRSLSDARKHANTLNNPPVKARA